MLKVINQVDDFSNLVNIVSEKLQHTTNLVILLLETSESCTLYDINRIAESLGLGHTLHEIKQESECDNFSSLNSQDANEETEESTENLPLAKGQTNKNNLELRNEDNCLPDHFMIQTSAINPQIINEECETSVDNLKMKIEENSLPEHFMLQTMNVKEEKPVSVELLPEISTEEFKTKEEKKIKVKRRKRSREKIKEWSTGFCTDCGKVFADIRKHRKRIHDKIIKTPQLSPEEKEIMSQKRKLQRAGFCEECGKEFSDFKQHRKTVHDGIKPMCKAGFCPYEGCNFFHMKKLMRENHINVVHLNLPKKTFPCEICGKAFAEPRGVTLHIRKDHSKERPYECDECGTTFATNSLLNQHKQIHSDVLRFVCQYCGKGFKQNAVLYRHKLSCPSKN